MELPNDHQPLKSYCPPSITGHSPLEPLGNCVRRTDARLRLRDMDAVEEEITDQLTQAEAIEHSLERQATTHRINMDYLMRFGVQADQRHEFRVILQETMHHGLLTLKEAKRYMLMKILVREEVGEDHFQGSTQQQSQ